MKKIIPLQLLLLLTLACSFTWPLRPAEATATPNPPTVTPEPTATLIFLPPAPTPSYSLYENQKYGFSFSHPDFWPLTVQSDEYVEIGDKVVIIIWTADPLSLPGDRPIYETVTDAQPGAYPGKLVTGYIGSIGGYIPQQIRMYVFEHNGYYIAFTLYALGLNATEGDVSQIAPIFSEEEKIFDNVVAGLQFR